MDFHLPIVFPLFLPLLPLNWFIVSHHFSYIQSSSRYFNKYITSVTTYQFKSYWWTWNPTVFLAQAQSYLLTFAQYHQVKDLFSNCLNRKGMFIKSSPLELTIIIWGTISFFSTENVQQTFIADKRQKYLQFLHTFPKFNKSSAHDAATRQTFWKPNHSCVPTYLGSHWLNHLSVIFQGVATSQQLSDCIQMTITRNCTASFSAQRCSSKIER